VLAQARLGLGEAAHYPVHTVFEHSPVSVYWCP
jgi:hypothetical protein